MNGNLFPVAILTGGMATRLRPLTDTIPKALVEIRGEPFIAHQLRLLKNRGISSVILCTGYRGEMIENYIQDGARFSMHVSYSHDGPVLLGTAGAIRKALPLAGENFFVLYGDSYLPCDYAAIQKAFQDVGRSGLMTVYRNEGQWDASNVEYRDSKIIAYDKRKRTSMMRHIDYGAGVFRASAFSGVPDGIACDLVSVYQHLLEKDDLAAFEVKERFYEVGSLEGIRELDCYLASSNRPSGA